MHIIAYSNRKPNFMTSKKVILVGHFGVGKTSLVRQFVHQKFSDEYLTTIGVKIDKKEMSFDNGNSVTLILWDIAGETTSAKIPASYKLGAHGVLYVFDVSRPSTFENLTDQISDLRKMLPDAPIICLANKSDLLASNFRADIEKQIGDQKLLFTSAKSGENVQEAFEALTKDIMSWD